MDVGREHDLAMARGLRRWLGNAKPALGRCSLCDEIAGLVGAKWLALVVEQRNGEIIGGLSKVTGLGWLPHDLFKTARRHIEMLECGEPAERN